MTRGEQPRRPFTVRLANAWPNSATSNKVRSRPARPYGPSRRRKPMENRWTRADGDAPSKGEDEAYPQGSMEKRYPTGG